MLYTSTQFTSDKRTFDCVQFALEPLSWSLSQAYGAATGNVSCHEAAAHAYAGWYRCTGQPRIATTKGLTLMNQGVQVHSMPSMQQVTGDVSHSMPLMQ